MPDLLVKLYDLEKYRALAPLPDGFVFRPALPAEKTLVVEWVAREFKRRWADQVEMCFTTHPCSCMIALQAGRLVGFACYDGTLRGYFGPVGVAPDCRSAGVGRALTFLALEGLYRRGYGYGIIGWAGPVAYYERFFGAIVIPGSEPGINGGGIESVGSEP
jgi:ribosomal protein S18 acetylase RimI-like enzyme